MKHSPLIMIALLLSGHLALAGFKVPKSIFTIDELDEAKQEATADKEPLIFVYTDPGST
ncbi:hypothetical protein [Rubritalea marina]|uniref:hypothetical protein n=1 Tax=Rubritalea marina TaxID=361055 RepID=UPI00035DA51F|nr:hypothetical protein [Rubritalea marina]